MVDSIIRTPTDEERRDFTPIAEPGKRKTVKEVFIEKLNEEQAKANKKGLPFCDRAAKDDFEEHYESQAKKSMKEHGYVKMEDIKPVKINWEKYSDLKNFELIDEGEVFDEFLTKRNPGLTVNAWKKVYKFKGYSNKYTLMEDGPSSIARAIKARQELEKSNK